MSIKFWNTPPSLLALSSSLIKGILRGGLALLIVAPSAEAQVSNMPAPWVPSYRIQIRWIPGPEVPQGISGQGIPRQGMSGQVLALRRAIIGQESGTNFRAVNPHSGALGYGQVMPANVPSWSREALGYSVSPENFLNNPEIQLLVIDYKLNQFWQNALVASSGDEAIAVRRVAAQWYSGRPHRYNSNTPQFYNGHRYPSVAEYSLSVLHRYQQQLGVL